MQVSKPFASFFHDENLESMQVRVQLSEQREAQNDDTDNNASNYIEADQRMMEENEDGDGDGDDMGHDED